MSNILDAILIKEMIDSPTTVNTDFETDSIDISNREAEFSIQIDYDSGVNVDMDISVSLSNDNESFVPITDSTHTITDADGTSLFDIAGTGANFLKVEIVVNTGSIDLQMVRYSAKRRH